VRSRDYTISLLVRNRFGVLAQVSGLISARGYNIRSLSVGETEKKDVSRITMVVTADDRKIEQVKKQLNKLIDTLKVADLTDKARVERELILVKVRIDATKRAEVIQIAEVFRYKVVDVAPKSLSIEATGNPEKINALLRILEPFGIEEIARTGSAALSRG